MSSPAKAPAKKRPRQKRRAFRHGVGQVYSERRDRWVWSFDIRVSGRRIQESGFPTREKAEAAASKLKLRALDQKYGLPSEETAPSVTLAQLVAARTGDPQRKSMPSYHDSTRILEMFRDYFRAGQTVTAITTADVRDWLAHNRAGLGSGTIHTELTYISSLLRSASSYFPELEGWQPPRLPYPRKPEERNRPITLQEVKAIIEWLRAPGTPERERVTRRDAADIFRLALMTGMRQSEWRLRRWSQVNFEAGTVTLTRTKTGKTRIIGMSPSVRGILARRFSERQGISEFVFQGRPGPVPHPITMTPIRRQIVLACSALRIPYGRTVEGGLIFHDTRHTAITEMLGGGNDLATVADISGHSKKSMTMRYGHATSESRERAMRTLEKFSFGAESEEKLQVNSGDEPEIS